MQILDHDFASTCNLSWELEGIKGFTSSDGSLLQISSDNLVGISTSQVVTPWIEYYSWQVEIDQCSKDAGIGIGFVSDSNFIRYWSHTGNIDSKVSFIEESEPVQVSDTISCHMRKIDYSGCKIQKCTIMKNEKILGAWNVDGKNLRPKIWFDPMQDEMKTAVLKSTLGNSKYCPNQGMHTFLHKVLTRMLFKRLKLF